MHKFRYNALEIEFSIVPKSPLLIQAGGISPNPALPDMRFVRTYHQEKGEVIYIPGTSLKGVFRSFSEKVLRTIKGNIIKGACNILEKKDSCVSKSQDEKEKKSYEIYKGSCRACRVFGNTDLKGRIRFSDAYPQEEVKTEIRHSVAISRLTHAVASGPFDMEVIVKGNFKTKVYLENFEAWSIGLLALTFQGLNDGIVKIGFGKNRGFGEIGVNMEKVEFLFSENLPSEEIWGIGKLVAKEEREKYGLTEQDYFSTDAKSISSSDIFYFRKTYEASEWNKLADSALEYLKEVLK